MQEFYEVTMKALEEQKNEVRSRELQGATSRMLIRLSLSCDLLRLLHSA
jgi:hypothetical protein